MGQTEAALRGGMNPPEEPRCSQDHPPHLLTMLVAALESAGEAVVVTDTSGAIIYTNPAFEQVSGWSRTEALGKNPRILQSGEESRELYAGLWQTISSGRIWTGSFRNRRKDGSLYHVEQTIAPVKDETGELVGYVSVHEDVTERVTLQRQLQAVTDERLRLLEKETAFARSVQQRLYPQAAPQLAGFEIAGRTLPATALCGDYFDFIPLRDGRLAAVVGDVCGHGIGPALVMVETRAWLRSLLRQNRPLNEILEELNTTLVSDLLSTMFVTLFVAIVDPVARTAQVAGAGQAARLIRADGSIEKLTGSGPFVGMFPDLTYEPPLELSLKPGDVLLLTSDGLHETESPSGERFGMDRVIDLARRNPDASSTDLITLLQQAATNFAGHPAPNDDITIVVIRAVP